MLFDSFEETEKKSTFLKRRASLVYSRPGEREFAGLTESERNSLGNTVSWIGVAKPSRMIEFRSGRIEDVLQGFCAIFEDASPPIATGASRRRVADEIHWQISEVGR